MNFSRILLLAVAAAALTGCTPVQNVATLNFRAGVAGGEIDAATLLPTQLVPADRLLDVPEAVERAPDGSVIVACQAGPRGALSWGLCSHITRKLSAGLLTESPNLFAGGVQTVPTSTLYRRAVVIVLDTGVTLDKLPALRAEAQRLNRAPYSVGGMGPDYDCSTYQNALQRAAGLPDVVPRNAWGIYLPQDAVAGGRVLWVGIQKGEGGS
ncbi:hypothetical protein [Deinococcus puniceus]|uniref:Lipoprotein n=1 Tax=Deinococcus puniceus TaxID=1182568 RepID=A0A172TA14_9DEIO|nr:hypothetical protein [Deinococcus puniceus]ANE43653.1 hypothetical protein SU48_07595 [Deinococcus puniceus]